MAKKRKKPKLPERKDPAEALAQLVTRLPSNEREEACRLATRYMAVAPNGYDAPDVRRVASRCR